MSSRRLLRLHMAIVSGYLLLCAPHADVLAGEQASPQRTAVELKARPFDLSQIRLLEGPFRDAMMRDRQYLHQLEADRLLHMFRVTAGLPARGEAYGGWERTEVRGHTMGHYLSACARMVAGTGDQELREKANQIVAELAKCQQALGESGYLSAFPESFFDRVENLQPVWAPYYTLHKIMAGLLDMHVHCGNQQALDVVCGMARWCKGRCDHLSDSQMQQMLQRTEQGGMNEVLANLYAVTGEQDFLDLSRRFVQRSYNDPLAAGRDELRGQHVNSFIPNMIGTARQYELTGNREDYDVAHYFWHQVTGHRCYCTGGTSNEEHWRTGPDQLATELGDHTQETCCTYNMLKLTRHLFQWDPQAAYFDYYERALWNSILSTQDPETGMMMYFVTLAPGRWKYYNTPTNSFWCCTGTGLENHAKYGDSIYFQDRDGLFVNLFIASELDWTEKQVRIRQETKFPEESTSSLIVRAEHPTEFTMRIRVPGWLSQRAVVQLNGQKVDVTASPSSYLAIHRQWHDGDRVDLQLPMELRAAPMPDDQTVMAFLYGPFVLAGQLGGEGLTSEMVYTTENFYRFPRDEIATAPVLTYDGSDPTACVEPSADQPLTFQTVGLDDNVTLVPYHRLFGQRYVVYWRVFRAGSPEHRKYLADQQARVERLARTVDSVEIGDRSSERKHDLQGERMANGVHRGRAWRHASDGGYFTYKLAVPPDEPAVLCVTYWGSDSGARSFDILVNGQKIASVALNNNHPDEFFDAQYELPRELTKEAAQITVRFQAHPGNIAGGIFGLSVLKK